MLLSSLRIIYALMLICPDGLANDSPSLPLGVVLDDKGQPLLIPEKPKAALSYTPIQQTKTPVALPSNNKTKTKTKTKKTSRKQQLASRQKVANDAGCRWLNSRMTLLEKNVSLDINHRNIHLQQELNARQNEWECLKCGTEGPNLSDHNSCQYRR